MAMTPEQVQQTVKEVMMEQQSELLKLAAANALSLVKEEAKKTSSSLLDQVDKEIDKAKTHDSHIWKSDINKSNYGGSGGSNGVKRKLCQIH